MQDLDCGVFSHYIHTIFVLELPWKNSLILETTRSDLKQLLFGFFKTYQNNFGFRVENLKPLKLYLILPPLRLR